MWHLRPLLVLLRLLRILRPISIMLGVSLPSAPAPFVLYSLFVTDPTLLAGLAAETFAAVPRPAAPRRAPSCSDRYPRTCCWPLFFVCRSSVLLSYLLRLPRRLVPVRLRWAIIRAHASWPGSGRGDVGPALIRATLAELAQTGQNAGSRYTGRFALLGALEECGILRRHT